MASVIADTSPLQYLFQLDLLDVLRTLYGNVIAPEAVRDELLVGRWLGLDVPDPADFPWITLRSTTTHASVAPLELGAGETAALSLALEVADPIVILDDAVARTAAATLNIPSTGTLGVLLLAKERGLVTSSERDHSTRAARLPDRTCSDRPCTGARWRVARLRCESAA